MISRRTFVGGLAALAIPGLSGCAGPSRQAPPRLAATPQPVLTPSAAGLDAVIDLSHTCRVFDFSLARAQSGVLAVLHKATEGGDYVDPLYAERQLQAEAAGLLWGAYHYGTRMYPGAQQAANFLAAARPTPTTLLALDLEPNERNPGNTMMLDQAEDFVSAVYQATGRFPLLYTHPTWANGGTYGRARMSLGGAIGSGSILANCDLWLADYRMEPELPFAWADRGWRLWQYAGDDSAGGGGPFGPLSRAVSGVERCDRNLFAGNAIALYNYWSGILPMS